MSTFKINLDSLSLNDIEIFEEITGIGIDSVQELMKSDRPKAKVLKTLYWLAARKDDPELTLEKAGDVSLAEDPFGTQTTDDVPDSEPPPESVSTSL